MGKHSVIKSLHLDSEENPLDHQMDYMVMDENNREVARFLFKESAQQLVTAVNYHDKLMEALRSLLEEYEDIDLLEPEPEDLTTAVRVSRILLRELEGL